MTTLSTKKDKARSTRQIRVLVILMLAELFVATVDPVQGLLFPQAAEEVGATPTETGMVFGVFELILFLVSPFIGSRITAKRCRLLVISGLLVMGFCSLVFGTLKLFPDRTSFVILSLLVRMTEAVGFAAFEVATFTLIAVEFPDSVSQTFGIIEACHGFGLVMGPTLAGGLYELNGYIITFIALGVVFILIGFAALFLLEIPIRNDLNGIAKGNGELPKDVDIPRLSGFESFKILRNSSMFLTAFGMTATTAGVGFLEATLERRIEEKNPGLNKVLAGGIFMLSSGSYAVFSPFLGKLCDDMEDSVLFAFFGSSFTIAGFLFIGPLLPFGDGGLWNIMVGQVLFGVGFGSMTVSAFAQGMKSCLELGYPDDSGTYGWVSGICTSMMALGYLVGSVAGGILTTFVKFRYATGFIVGLHIILCMLLVNKSTSETI